MRRGWCYSSYKCDELITVFIRIEQIEIPIERHTLRIEKRQAVLNPSGPALTHQILCASR